jgi:ribosomal protein S4
MIRKQRLEPLPLTSKKFGAFLKTNSEHGDHRHRKPHLQDLQPELPTARQYLRQFTRKLSKTILQKDLKLKLTGLAMKSISKSIYIAYTYYCH